MNKREQNRRPSHEPPLYGTFLSVMLLGGFLVVTWLGVFLLYAARS